SAQTGVPLYFHLTRLLPPGQDPFLPSCESYRFPPSSFLFTEKLKKKRRTFTIRQTLSFWYFDLLSFFQNQMLFDNACHVGHGLESILVHVRRNAFCDFFCRLWIEEIRCSD